MKEVRLYFVLLLLVALYASCVKKNLFDPPGPVVKPTGVMVNIDWTQVTGNFSDFNISLGDKNIPVVKGEQPDTIFSVPGTSELFLFSKPHGIVVNSPVADIDTDESGYLFPDPGLFYSATEHITIEAGIIAHANMIPVLQTQRLVILINDSTRALSATMNNVAKTYNMRTGERVNADTVAFGFVKNKADLNLWGVTGSTNILHIKMSGSSSAYSATIDIRPLLEDWLTDKSDTLKITVDDYK